MGGVKRLGVRLRGWEGREGVRWWKRLKGSIEKWRKDIIGVGIEKGGYLV